MKNIKHIKNICINRYRKKKGSKGTALDIPNGYFVLIFHPSLGYFVGISYKPALCNTPCVTSRQWGGTAAAGVRVCGLR